MAFITKYSWRRKYKTYILIEQLYLNFLQKITNKSWKDNICLEDKKMADQIDKDVTRSLNSYKLESLLNHYRSQLSNILLALFQTNKEWSYIQGFNDVWSVFLYVVNEDMGYHTSWSATRYFMKDYLRSNIELGVIPALKLMMGIIKENNIDVYNKLSFMDTPTFAVSWIITWFAHDLDNIKDVFRIYDFWLASHPSSIIYLSAATVTLVSFI